MTRKTSISLSDEDDALLHSALEAGDTLRSIIRRGLGVERTDLAMARAIATEVVGAAERRLRDFLAEAVGEAHDDMEGTVERKIRAALREAQGGGSW